jgi:S1-C subfamily serine protease
VSEHGSGTGTEHDPHRTGAPGTPPAQPGPAQPVAGATTPFPPAPPAGPAATGQHTGTPWGWGQAPTHPAQAFPPPQAQQPYAQTGQWPAAGAAPTAVLASEQPPARRAGRMRIGVAGLVAGALIGGGAGAGVTTLLDEPSMITAAGATGQSVVIQNPETATTATAAAAKAAPSVVTIYVANGSNSGSGSGVVLSADGAVLTNNHVVTLDGNGTGGTVQARTSDGTLYDATVVGTDPASDLAVIQLDGASGLTPAKFADSDKVQVGDVAVAIGAPLGLSNTVTDGIISATNRAVATGSTQDDATVIDALQTDAAINPGNSGGALVNGAGEVIGINSAIATVASGAPSSQSQSGNIGVGFAIPSNTAERIAKEIRSTGSATRAFLGVRAQTAADGQNSGVGTGAQVVSVEADSAAGKAGIQDGDVITAVGDRPVTTSTELTAAVRSQAPGEKVTLSVRRGADSRNIPVTLGSSS